MPKSKKTSSSVAEKEWTLMFYFASDNPLAPGILSQLKSIQQAGFHPEVNVVAQYDPQTERTPLHVFEVNKADKLRARHTKKPFQIGFKPDDPFVPNLVLDKLWGEQQNIDEVLKEIGAAGADYKQPPPPGFGKKKSSRANPGDQEPGPKESLGEFLKFCREHYKARHYMLFILGHGLVVGNDMFLFDEHAAQRSLSLTGLGDLLRGFNENIALEGGKLEFLSFHSCSMSGLEVAYELEGMANYMLASQGPAFVGSWPYRQILMRVFQDVVEKEPDVKQTLKKIFSACLSNSSDFQLAGYSFDLCLCDLSKVAKIKVPLRALSATLAEKVADRLVRDCILLAHWDAQSYWGESYTDLYDFCLRLNQRCEDAKAHSKKANAALQAIQNACCGVIKELKPGVNQLIIDSGFAGPEYQYSHGLSVFFPWSAPANGTFWLGQYESYKFSSKSEGIRWIEFLEQYFEKTMRDPRGSESRLKGKAVRKPPSRIEVLLDRMAPRGVAGFGQLDGPAVEGGDKGSGSDVTGIKGSGSDVTGIKGSGSDVTGKGSGSDATGGDFGPSIKNYPPYTLAPPISKQRPTGKRQPTGKQQAPKAPFECPE